MSEAHHAIKAVALRTGLSTHVIRIWEQRYGAVEPERTATNRRLYSDAQIERLWLLRDLTKAGHSIGQIAKLPTDKLHKLLRESGKNSQSPSFGLGIGPAYGAYLEKGMKAVQRLDAVALEEMLKEAVTELGAQGLLHRVIAPFVQSLGELWRNGLITAGHEHFASAVLRTFLAQMAKPFGGADSAPVVLVATPAGQLHELGALLVGAAASNLGWRVTYLGASLPAAEIAGVARQKQARAVALSLVYPDDDPHLGDELIRLRALLPSETVLLVGGRAMTSYHEVLDRIEAIQLKDLTHLSSTLDQLRHTAMKVKR